MISCGHQTESSMNLEQISKIKDPCIFIDEYQKLINDFEYFSQNPTNNTSKNRVADVLFSYSQFFCDDFNSEEAWQNSSDNLFPFPEEFTKKDCKEYLNYKSTRESFFRNDFLKEFCGRPKISK